METKLLSKIEIEVMNARYELDLSYTDATHYRAAQVIWSLGRQDPVTVLNLEEHPSPNTPEVLQDHEDIA